MMLHFFYLYRLYFMEITKQGTWDDLSPAAIVMSFGCLKRTFDFQ